MHDPTDFGSHPSCEKETDPVSETVCSSTYQLMNEVQKRIIQAVTHHRENLLESLSNNLSPMLLKVLLNLTSQSAHYIFWKT
jgi:hypothetical protein